LVILFRQIVYLFCALAKEHDDLASVNAYVLSEYCQSVLTALNTRGCNFDAREKEARLHAVERLHYSAPDLPAADRLRRPSWLDEELSFDRSWRGENTTQEMAPDTYAPLIVWACAFIDEFATDILAARDRVAQMTDGAVAAQPGKGADAVRAALRDWLATYGSLPGSSKRTWGVDRGQVNFASTYMEGVFGLSRSAVQWVHQNDDEFRYATVARGAPLDVHVRGRIHGQQWLSGIDFYDVDFWLARLREACMIVVGLGSGLRPHEMLSLEIEASKDDGSSRPVIEKVESDTGHVRFLVHGRLFKGQTDISGSQRLDGVPVTWETIETGAKAAALAIQLTDGSPLVFPSQNGAQGSTDEAMATTVGTYRLQKFADTANRLADLLDLPQSYRIPRPESLTLRQFRRTALAMIEDQKDGLNAGAQQAKHVVGSVYETETMEGYGDTRRRGQLVHERRAALSVAATTELSERLVTSGEGISGPAVQRALEVVKAVGGDGALLRLTDERDFKRRAARSKQKVYKVALNGTSWYCIHDRTQAACGTGEFPELGECRIVCPNKVYTDSDRRLVWGRIGALEAEAAVLPVPAAQRKLRLAAGYRAEMERAEGRIVHLDNEEDPQA